jgi:hypothetical protein
MTSEVTVIAGDLPLTAAQIDKLAKIVLKRLADKRIDAQRAEEATKLKRQSTSPFEAGS